MKYLCFDDGGASFDRFTVFYKPHGWGPWCEYIAASEYPFHPQGFGQHGETRPFWRRSDMAHLGAAIRFADLPEQVQAFARQQEAP